MKTFSLAVLVGFATALDAADHFKFQQFMTQHGKSYGTIQEYSFRLDKFMKTDAAIIEHNESGASFTLGHNKMSDWTEEEYKKILTHREMPEEEKNY
jgi:C1A family cysteine protease